MLMAEKSGNGNISIGGNVHGSAIVTGNNNKTAVRYTETQKPDPSSVDLASELAAIREILAGLKAPDQRKIDRALEDVTEEAQKAEPDPDEVGDALQRALKYAQHAGTFSQIVGKLEPHVLVVSAWLGSNWDKLLTMLPM
jgi:hypothetical protein